MEKSMKQLPAPVEKPAGGDCGGSVAGHGASLDATCPGAARTPSHHREFRGSAIVFDLGKVLLDFSYARLAEKLNGRCRISAPELLRGLDQSPLLSRYETNQISSTQFFAEVQALTGFNGSFDEFKTLFADIFTPIQPMIDLQASVRQRGYPSYIFSNTNFLAVEHIRARYPFFNRFDGYILSCEHGLMKPDPRIYQIVESVTRRSGLELVYIDDREENIQTALARGWRAIHHRHPRETIQQLTATGLLEGSSPRPI